MTECSVCGTEESKMWLSKGTSTLCEKCSESVNDFSFQPNMQFNIDILAEVFFRRGKGEDVTYEELHREKSHFKFMSLRELLNLKNLEKKNDELD